mmetsp:Transcript_6442/g.10933  ORF Transcript_6442/g.10933 Transcript_6442/m.10933 type:complete len:561 (-) Transcript_6442:37-1719(-)
MSVLLLILSLYMSPAACTGNGRGFLKADTEMAALEERVSEEEVQNSLLGEIEGHLGEGTASARLGEMEAILQNMFLALPRNEHGNLGHAAVRYALHRLFVQRHGWFVKGLDPASSAWNSSSPAGILKDQVPAYIQSIFEKRLGARGLGVHEIAVLAAAVEHLVHAEASGRMALAFQLHGFSPMDFVLETEADSILDTYMTIYIMNLKNLTKEEAQYHVEEMPDVYLHWNETQKFVRDARHNVSKGVERTGGEVLLDFAKLVRVAETLGEQFGRFQNAECQQLKSTLLRHEDRGTGRVQLSDFYKNVSDGSWQFLESPAYLRQLGALDESVAENPRVVVANYLSSATNCIAASGFYSVCCMNECEGLLSHLEAQLKAPEALAERIAALVSQLPSPSVHAPRNLTEISRRRLQEIGEGNGGMVPLHGRLFLQWMHHAFPRECPYPHLSGTTSSQSPEEWTEGTGIDSQASDEEVKQYLQNATKSLPPVAAEDIHEIMPWSEEEELLVVRPAILQPGSQGIDTSIARSAILFTVLGSMAFSLVAIAGSTRRKPGKIVSKKYVV